MIDRFTNIDESDSLLSVQKFSKREYQICIGYGPRVKVREHHSRSSVSIDALGAIDLMGSGVKVTVQVESIGLHLESLGSLARILSCVALMMNQRFPGSLTSA